MAEHPMTAAQGLVPEDVLRDRGDVLMPAGDGALPAVAGEWIDVTAP